jgi:hypothetical protein
MTPIDPTARLPRRLVLGWMAAAAAASQLGGLPAFGAEPPANGLPPLPAGSKGYGTDPKVQASYKPGDLWPLTLSAAEKRTVTALADVILPADDLGPAASDEKIRVPDYIDEWISAPYPGQQKDREVIVPGLAWLESEAAVRFLAPFPSLTSTQQHAICDDICSIKNATAAFEKAAVFFARFRGLAAGAYYASQAGWKAIGYVGNLPQAVFNGPPPEVLAKLELT